MERKVQELPIYSPDELLHLIEVLTRQRDSSLVRLSAIQSLLTLVRPESIRLYDVLKQGDQYRVMLSIWSEDGKLHFSDAALFEGRFESIAPDSALAKSLGGGDAYHCVSQGDLHECCIPVVMNDEPVSLFEMRGSEPFGAEAMAVAAGVVAVFRNYLELLEDSQRDTLTGLLNRKTFDAGFAVFLTSAMRSEPPLSEETVRVRHAERRARRDGGSHWLAVIDIDHFKRVNDTFGHLYGDEVLILMANLMRGSFRHGDRLYRFGGEEFVVLMRDADFADAHRRLEDFRQRVEQHAFPQVGQVTVSIGFASVSATSTPSIVLGNADEALYYAKEHGRNQVRCYGDLVEQKLLAEKTVHTSAEFF